MENTHLSKLLSTLTTKELKLLKKWVASPFYNQRTDVIQLLDFYLRYRKNQAILPSKTAVFDHLYPNETYDDHKVRMAMSILNRLTEKFIIHQQQEKKTIENKLALLAYYREKELEKPYQKVVKEVEKTIQKDLLRGIDYYRAKFLLGKEQYESTKLTNRYQPKKVLQEVSANLDICILLEKLNESSFIQNDARVTGTPIPFDLGLMKQLKTAIEAQPAYLENPTIATYYACYQLSSKIDDPNYFIQLRGLLTAHHSIFSKKELTVFYTFLSGSCIINFNKGKQKYLVTIFEIYKEKLALGLYEQKIAFIAFKNIVLTGLLNKAYDWIEQFIVKYIPKLEQQDQHTTGNWALAALAHRRKDYETALKILSTTKFKDYHQNLSARVTVTKIYLELAEWDVLQNHLKAFEAYARRVPDMGELGRYKTNYLNFTLLAQKILRLNPYDYQEKSKLIQLIQTSTSVVDKKWLLTWLEEGKR